MEEGCGGEIFGELRRRIVYDDGERAWVMRDQNAASKTLDKKIEYPT